MIQHNILTELLLYYILYYRENKSKHFWHEASVDIFRKMHLNGISFFAFFHNKELQTRK